MATLTAFITSYVPVDLQNSRAFTGARNWCDICNQLLRRLEREGLGQWSRSKEVGVEVQSNYWITIPGDCRVPTRVYYRTGEVDSNGDDQEVDIPFEIVNGKIKLSVGVEKDDSPDTFTLSAWTATGVSINDTDATADLWNDYLLVVTNGSLSGKTFVVSDSAAVVGGVAALTLYPSSTTLGATSTAGYLTADYVMLEYDAPYTVTSGASDEIPVDDMYEDVLISGFAYLACPVTDERFMTFEKEFERALDSLRNEQFTPTEDQARPRPRPMPGIVNISGR